MITLKQTLVGSYKVLNLTDPQLSCGDWDDPGTRGIFEQTVKTLVSRVSPGLITVSGDFAYAGGTRSYREYAEFFTRLGIPWTCCFGNHDNQGGDEPIEHDLEIFRESPLFLWEDCPKELGHGNFALKIGSCALILMDTHDRAPFTHADGSVTDDWAKLTGEQIAWYRKQVRELKNAGAAESVLITHIPIHAYREAAEAAYRAGLDQKALPPDARGEAVFNEGFEAASGVYREGICSYPEDEGMLDVILSEGHTKTVLCGHDHINNFIIPYRGIRFVYALKTGRGCYWDSHMNGGTVIEISPNGSAEVRHEYVEIP